MTKAEIADRIVAEINHKFMFCPLCGCRIQRLDEFDTVEHKPSCLVRRYKEVSNETV